MNRLHWVAALAFAGGMLLITLAVVVLEVLA